MPGPSGHAHAEDGRLEPFVNFDYDAIERGVFQVDGESITDRDIEAATKIFRALVAWIWQDGMRNPEGINIRAIICCWVFLEHLHPLTLTDISRSFGKKKQSLGRWVDDFKREFPDIVNPHMKAPGRSPGPNAVLRTAKESAEQSFPE